MSFSDTFIHWFHPRRSNNHRPKLLHTSVIASLTVVVFALAFVAQPIKYGMNSMGKVLGYASDINANEVISQINTQRQGQGEAPLKVNSSLNQAAFAKAENMFAQQYWAHVGPDGTEPWFFFKQANYQYSIAGENLARDFGNTTDMVQAWMASPTHKENILNGRYQETGVAVVNGTLLGTETTLVVQLFGTPRANIPAVTADASQTTQALASSAPTAKPTAKPTLKPKASPVVLANTPVNSPEVSPEPTPSPELTFVNNPSDEVNSRTLGSTVLPITVLSTPPLFSPLQLIKAFFLAIIFVLSATLFYDWVIMSNSNSVRLVGKNVAHILLLLTVAFLLVFFKGGIIG